MIGILNAFTPQEPSAKTLILLVVSWLASAVLLFSSPGKRALSGGATGAVLAIFVSMTFFSCLLAQLIGFRADANDMWRMASQALAPALLYWGCHAWASTRFRASPVDKGVLIIGMTCVASIFLEATGLAMYEAYGTRYFGFMGDTVAWLTSFAATYLVIRRKLLVASLCIIALILTQSRAATVVFLFAISLFLLLSPNGANINRRSKLVVVGLFAIISILFWDLMSGSFSRIVETNFIENDRIRTMEYTFNIFKDSPLIGSGFGAHTYIYLLTNFQNIAGLELWITPTSTLIQILADSGLIGFVPFFMFFLLVVRRSFYIIRARVFEPEYLVFVGLSVWLIAYLLLNQSAAWLLPGSRLSPIVFAVSGIVVGSGFRIRASR